MISLPQAGKNRITGTCLCGITAGLSPRPRLATRKNQNRNLVRADKVSAAIIVPLEICIKVDLDLFKYLLKAEDVGIVLRPSAKFILTMLSLMFLYMRYVHQ